MFMKVCLDVHSFQGGLWSHLVSLTQPHVSCACPKVGIVVIGLSLCYLFCSMYILIIFNIEYGKSSIFYAYTMCYLGQFRAFYKEKALWRLLDLLIPLFFYFVVGVQSLWHEPHIFSFSYPHFVFICITQIKDHRNLYTGDF